MTEKPCDCLSRLENVIRGLKSGELTGVTVTTMQLKNGLETFDSFYHEMSDAQVLKGLLGVIENVRDKLENPPEPPGEVAP